MIDWAILAVYILGYLLGMRYIAQRVLSKWDNDYRRDVTDADRWEALGMAAVFAIGWPVVVPVMALSRYASVAWLRSDKEIQQAQRDELYRLRDLARQYGLPMGDEQR